MPREHETNFVGAHRDVDTTVNGDRRTTPSGYHVREVSAPSLFSRHLCLLKVQRAVGATNPQDDSPSPLEPKLRENRYRGCAQDSRRNGDRKDDP